MRLRDFPLWRRYTTRQNKRYWEKRGGWAEYQKTADHPHRTFISMILRQISWISLLEVGCGSGPNLINIANNIPNKQLAGVDINAEAIELCSKTFKNGHFRVADASNMLVSDKASDIVLSDMMLIYIDPLRIDKYLKEMTRVARNYLILCEYHHKSWWKRQYLRVFSGRHSYDYKKRLKKLGFHDIKFLKMPEFEQDNEQDFRHLIIAKVPKM